MIESLQKTGRAVPLLSGRGIYALIIGAVIILAALAFGVALDVAVLVIAGFSALIICHIALDYRDLRLLTRTLKIDIDHKSAIFSGVETPISVSATADNVRDNWHLQFRPLMPEAVNVSPEILECSLEKLVPSNSVQVKLTALSRGDIKITAFYGRLKTSRSLICWQLKFNVLPALTIHVRPNEYCASSKHSRGFQNHLTGQRSLEQSGGEGKEFDSLRQYSPGDDLRKVDWKRSARGESLLVRNYRPESHQRMAIAIDCSRRMSNRIDQRLQLDHAADAAALLVRLAREHDDEVGMLAFNHAVVSALPCRRVRSHERQLSRALVNMETGMLEADYQLVTRWGLENRRRSLLLLLTSVSNPGGLEDIRQALLPLRQKHLPIVIAISDRGLQELINEPVNSTQDAYVAASASEQLESIETRVNWLKRSGIECIYTDVKHLPNVMQQKYFELKLSGRL